MGGVVALLILFLLILFFMRRRRLKQGRGAAAKNRKRGDVDLLPDEHPAAENGALAAGGAAAGMREAGNDRASISSATNTNTNTNTTGRGLAAPGLRERRSSAPSIPPFNFGRPSSDNSHGADTVLSSSQATTQPPFTRTSSGAPPSAFLNSSQGGRPTTPTSTSGARRSAGAGKGGAPGAMRPVNVVVHDDGGAIPQPVPGEGSTSPGGAEEVVELPPSYADVRRNSNV